MSELRRGTGTSNHPYTYYYHGNYITAEQAAKRTRLHTCTIMYRLRKTGNDMEAALDRWVDGRCRKDE